MADIPKTMMAVGLDPEVGGGGADKLVKMELSIPELEEHDVLVKLEACGMNPADYKVCIYVNYELMWLVDWRSPYTPSFEESEYIFYLILLQDLTIWPP